MIPIIIFFGEYYGSNYYRYKIYYIEKQPYYQDEITIYCNEYSLIKIKSNFKMHNEFNLHTTQKIMGLDSGFQYYHESR